jgi:hypothetical protein
MATATTTTNTMTTTTQGCSICAKRGGINWVDGGVTKQQSTNLAYVVAFEDTTTAIRTNSGRRDHDNNRQAGGKNRGDDWVDRGCGGGINTTINNL